LGGCSSTGGGLLGYDDYSRRKNDEKDRLSAQSEEWIEQSNDAHLDKIGAKISAMKDVPSPPRFIYLIFKYLFSP
jgi:hypothetical protein